MFAGQRTITAPPQTPFTPETPETAVERTGSFVEEKEDKEEFVVLSVDLS